MSNRTLGIHLQPINWVQRIALYVTHSRYYLVGSNNTQTAFKVLKVDRTENELNFVDDRVEYNYHEIRDLLMRIDHGNRHEGNSPGVKKTFSSFGLAGFVRFLHGYYLILIVKRRKVASIGYHTIYKVEDTKLVYIPNQDPTEFVNEELRYVKAFNSIDLTSNFYFSYSYDISHSLQYNLAPVRGARFLKNNRDGPTSSFTEEEGSGQEGQSNSTDEYRKSKPPAILVRTKPCDRFVWNSHLIDFKGLHDDWKVYLTHGFVEQANICVYSKPIYITIIARRSRRFCGTRFLKRGLNLDGDVANEVETEQIVHDASVSNFSRGFFTSFVQLRGSLPDRWSQDTTKIVAKPTIVQDVVDPYHEAPSKHFNDLLKRYGTPVVVLNLVKQKEKKPHESVLNDMITSSIGYLNQFLPQQHIIRLISFDMARCNKSRKENVMQRLGKIGFNIVRVTGIFQSWRSAKKSNQDNGHAYTMLLRQRTFNRKPSSLRIGGYRLPNGQCVQNGVVRVNCVDSLDRTNTAQFVLGKVALGFQLQALGVLAEPSLEYDTDAVRLLEQLYEDHGDTIALQYGGSQLVHRVKTYRKVAPISAHSSEIMQTLSRYYSNTFSDSEKQNVINIFLGLREALPVNVQVILNNPSTDYYLHNRILMQPFIMPSTRVTYRNWWDKDMMKSLPRAYYDYQKDSTCYSLETRDGSPTIEERIDYYGDAYRPYEMTYLASSFSIQILHTIKDFMPLGASNYSPFCLRLGPGKLKERYLRQTSSKKLPPNPSVYGLPSTSSATSDLSLIDSDISDESDLNDLNTHPAVMNTSSYSRANSSLRDIRMNESFTRLSLSRNVTSQEADNEDCYGSMKSMSGEDMELYKRYVDLEFSDNTYDFSRDLDLNEQSQINRVGRTETISSSLLFNYCAPSEEDLTTYKNYVTMMAISC